MKQCGYRARAALFACAFFSFLVPPVARADSSDEINLLSWGAGAIVVQTPPTEGRATGQWSADALLDELPDSGWANKRGDMSPKAIVIEMTDRSEITRLEFDTAQTYSPEHSARDVTVEISDRQDGGYSEIAKITLVKAKDGQKFPLSKPAQGRYVRLTVFNNYGNKDFMEIMNFKAYGKSLVKHVMRDYSGTYTSTFYELHLQQNGITVAGCYQLSSGLIENGGFEGRVLRFTWNADQPGGGRYSGPAILIFRDDGKSFQGHFWHEGELNHEMGGELTGELKSKNIGSCPNWKPGGSNQVEQQLKDEGRARLYGIQFDTDSDHLKDESKSTLDLLLAAAKSQPGWNFSIEGHTDNTGGDAHNQTLSDKRAAAVKAWLVAGGIDTKRLATAGLGSSHPVASNDTALGRSQNRRVEIVKK
jgi:OOP family OmpA-OmpF porin